MSDISRVLRLWRRTRHPDLEGVLRTLCDALADDPARAPAPASPEHWLWLRRLRNGDDRDVDELLCAVPQAEDALQAAERLELLWGRGPDPRVARAAETWLVSDVFSVDPMRGLWWGQLRVAVEHGLPRGTDFRVLARRIRAQRASESAGALATYVATFRSLAPPPQRLSKREERQLDHWCGAAQPEPEPAAADPRVERLIEAVVANPHDDGPREVLADLWLEAGDLRGELVRTQLQAARTADPVERIRLQRDARRLVTTHGSAWFGRWLMALTRCECERGFPHRLVVGRGVGRLDRLRGSPALRTVRVVTLPSGLPTSPVVELLADSALQNLERVDGLHLAALERVVERRTLPWTTLEVALAPGEPSVDLARLGGLLPRLPGLLHLDVPLARQHIPELRHLAVPSLTLEVPQLQPVSRWTKGVFSTLPTAVCRLQLATGDDAITFHRDASGKLTEWSGAG
ncbi:MAG: hypothetical protein KTR31_12550 [Myxococcales bacterium]|nr:hypothetical protein [Myxococcales bacterium]